MILCKVVGSIVSTIKHPSYDDQKLMIVRPVSPDGTLKSGTMVAVDTVGAGDCFCGVLAAAMAGGLDMPRALRRASAAAAISTTRRGAQPSMPARAEVDEFLRLREG